MEDVSIWLTEPTIRVGLIAGIVAFAYAIVACARAVRSNNETGMFYLLLSYHLVEPFLTIGFRISEVGYFGWWLPVPNYNAPVAASFPIFGLLVPRLINWHDTTLRDLAERLSVLGAARCFVTLAFVIFTEARAFWRTDVVPVVIVAGIVLLCASIAHAHYVLHRLRGRGRSTDGTFATE